MNRFPRSIAALALVGATVLGSFATADANSKKTTAAEPGSLSTVAAVVGVDDLWAQGITGAGVNVAVIDTGILPVPGLDDPDKVVAMVDLSGEADDDGTRYLDTYGHGTHMAGIIAGHDDESGFRGIAPDAGIVSVKVADNTGATDITQVIAAVDWVIEFADELDIGVINLSYSSGSPLGYEADPLSFAVERAWHAGIVVVVAAGNDGRSVKELASPADNPFVIAVAAAEVKKNGKFKVPTWATSGNGTRNPDISAPGTSIESLRAPGSRADLEHPEGYVSDLLFKGTGTSQAAAVVSGSVALLLQARPELTPDEVKALLQGDAARVSGNEKFSGAGMLQLAELADRPAREAAQNWERAVGDGSLDAARNGSPVVVDEIVDIDWEGARWSGARWSAGTWDGARWSGGEWMGARWSGASWSGARWAGDSWTGARWSGARWAGDSWTGARWSGARWSGDSWTGARWSGDSWSGARWS